ncbi:MAG: hypothetical protein ACYS76_14540 [Planctomycetota bacterium]|jgi:hypothetical protein
MDADETAPRTPRKIKISHVLIALLVVIIAAFVLFRVSVRAKLQKKLDAIRAAGYPVTWAELDEWYALPDGAENAADYLLEAFACYYKWNDQAAESLPITGDAELPPRTESLGEETKTLIAAYLADNNEAVRLLHEGAAVEHCRYPVDLTRGFAFLQPYLSQIRTGAKLLSLEAILHAENAQADLALRSVISGLGLARSFSREPTLISQLVRIACQALAVSSLEQVINRTDFTDEQLISLAQALDDARDRSAMSRAFAGERCCGIDLLTRPTGQKLALVGGDVLPLLVLQLCQALGLLDMEALLYLDLMDGYIKASRLPPHHRQKAASDLEERIEGLSRAHIFLRQFMPALSRVIVLDLRTIAHLRTAQVAIAVQRYRLAAVRLPHTLAELVPSYLDAVPKDPFDGKALRYKKLDPGFVVYSIDEDGTDDGGKERPKPPEIKADSHYDITFIVQR